jgi:hypothetical protein
LWFRHHNAKLYCDGITKLPERWWECVDAKKSRKINWRLPVLFNYSMYTHFRAKI